MTRWLPRLLDLLLLAYAASVVAEVGRAVVARATYGFDLEWMEGATLLSAMRAGAGESIYGLPTLDYIPFIYPPLYAWVVGALSHVVPLGYTLGRSVSTVGTLAAAAAIVYAARGAGARWSWALAGAAAFLGTYEDAGTFFDLVRTDGLAMGLLGWALVVAERPGRRAAVIGGLLLAVAFTAKHHAAMFGLPIALVRWRRDGWRDALTYGLCAAVPAGLFTIGMQVATGGLFLTWLLEVPASHGIVAERVYPWIEVKAWSPLAVKTGGAPIEVWKALPVLVTAALLAPAWAARRGGYWGVVTLIALVTVALMRGHVGGFVNVLIPGYWVAAVGGTLALTAAARWRWFGWVVPFLLAAQLYEGRADLTRYVPTEADRAAGAKLVETIRDLPDPVLIPHAPYYAVLAGKEPSFALICLWDISHQGGPLRREGRVVDRAMRQQHWGSIVLPDDKLGRGLKEHYRRARALPARAPGTRTGWGVRLREVWLPKAVDPDAPPPPDDDDDDDGEDEARPDGAGAEPAGD